MMLVLLALELWLPSGEVLCSLSHPHGRIRPVFYKSFLLGPVPVDFLSHLSVPPVWAWTVHFSNINISPQQLRSVWFYGRTWHSIDYSWHHNLGCVLVGLSSIFLALEILVSLCVSRNYWFLRESRSGSHMRHFCSPWISNWTCYTVKVQWHLDSRQLGRRLKIKAKVLTLSCIFVAAILCLLATCQLPSSSYCIQVLHFSDPFYSLLCSWHGAVRYLVTYIRPIHLSIHWDWDFSFLFCLVSRREGTLSVPCRVGRLYQIYYKIG